ncbi:MAG: type I restriction enzyme HsdR N-terminal domain-containing protein, partial [Patescibacteria group bacterium]|nr:type I restriction enzyme HsdR N-terminal domain-containing protein [Patescibacteria group bacterium]
MEKIIEDKLIASSLWSNKIEQDCKKQNVFLAIRDNRIDLYHNGGKLFGYDSNGYKTHLKYASAITANDKDYLTESELSVYRLASDFVSNYQRIKENCSNYSGIEASGVSDLYHKHSYLSNSNVLVLDIEISFESLNEKNNQDRIDILLYNKDSKTLQFVEAKHFSNKEIWSKTTPKVISQIKRYESQIAKRKSEILLEYTEYVKIVNAIFAISLPEPTDIEDNVTLLVFGFDNDQKNGRLKKLITKNPAYS